MVTVISCECYLSTCHVSSVSAQLIVAHSKRNWSCVWNISALRTHTHTHTLSLLGQTLLECQCHPVQWLQIIAYRPAAFRLCDWQLCITQPAFRDRVRGLCMRFTVSILIVHYYHIIILGGEMFIFLVATWKLFPGYDTVFALQQRTFSHSSLICMRPHIPSKPWPRQKWLEFTYFGKHSYFLDHMSRSWLQHCAQEVSVGQFLKSPRVLLHNKYFFVLTLQCFTLPWPPYKQPQ